MNNSLKMKEIINHSSVNLKQTLNNMNFNLNDENYNMKHDKENTPIINILENKDEKNKKIKDEEKKCNFDNYEYSDFSIFNLKSRYPKLIYSFKTYYKGIRKLLKNKNFNKAKFCEDILVLSEHINIDFFEKVILLYLNESNVQKNSIRQMEAVLEYIEFLIVYKLKIVLILEKKEKNDLDPILHENFLINPNVDLNKDKNDIGNLTLINVNINTNLLHDQNGKFINFNKHQGKYFINDECDKVKSLIKEYMKKIKLFLNYFKILKNKFVMDSSPDYFKNFMDIIIEKRKEDLDITEIPYTVLIMKCNYLKGKLAKLCGHYNKALEYFYKSREYLTICDAWIIKKSNKNIKKIYKIIYNKINENLMEMDDSNNEAHMNYIVNRFFGRETHISNENNNKKFNNHNLLIKSSINYLDNNNGNNNTFDYNYKKDEKSNKPNKHFYKKLEDNKDEGQVNTLHHNNINTSSLLKIEKLKKQLIENKADIENKINLINDHISSFDDHNKDLIILIDVSGIKDTDIKKYENLVKLSSGFYENYICLGDRFGMFICHQTITPLIPFEKKEINNYLFTKNNINIACKNLYNFVYINNNDNQQYTGMHICKCILLTYEYLNKKWNHQNEKFIILFSFNFSIDSEHLRSKIFNEELIKKYINLIIIGIDFDKGTIIKAREFLKMFGEKSHFIGNDDIGILKGVFRKTVLNEEKFFFPHEIYKARETNNINNFDI